ncbi:hypothetical protein B0T18DRAFT_440629 [Schizothecium vesticola]|uniref:MARVEL domain-containing protein n=1 Tax=Schizothecium vesticola TaxID=314040 RepID=A0AA40K0N8_9PEZI|nr:hypothetical protein B0T18DRAFT_440629 [Schizothecium vesticola]
MNTARPLSLRVAGVFLTLLHQCQERVVGIIEGNQTYNGIDNTTLWNRPLVYTGPIRGMDPRYSRGEVLTLTYEGCVALCGPDAQLQEPRAALSMVATWIFPLAIALSLPYEQFHNGKKIRRTIAATVNWLGSPQTALTATIHNFRQIREAHRRTTQRRRPSDPTAEWEDALYVLTCLNQYEISDISSEHLATLLYGLFRPTLQDTFDAHDDASLATFLVAFVFSVVLSFAEVGESSSVDPLILGLLFSWLPVLVIFTIVDRNPVSADRAKFRWLYNVRAVMLWRDGPDTDSEAIAWWPPVPPSKTEDENTGSTPPPEAVVNNQPQPELVVTSQPQQEPVAVTNLTVGRFIGQGRSTQYSGLSYAVMKHTPTKGHPGRTYPTDYNSFAVKVHNELEGRPPPSWFITALLAQAIVTTEVMLAFMLAFNTPTVGLGCWSGSFAIYAILSSLCWILSLCFPKPGSVVTGLCYTLNVLAFGWLVTVTILLLTGGMNTCYCQTSPFAYPWFGGYMTFAKASGFRDMFSVTKFWATAASFGLAIPIVVFVTAIFWWLKCAHLWKVTEDSDEGTEMMAQGLAIDTRWLVS